MYHCEEYQVISFNVMQMFNKMFIPSLNFILHDYLWRIHFPQKNIFMNIPVHVFSTKCEITQLQIILVILTDGKEF